MNSSLTRWMSEAPFTLAFSSSFFGFYAHCGIAMALEETGIRPQKITGASAGALIGAAMASNISSSEMREIVLSVRKTHFWDPMLGFGYLGGKRFLNFVEQHMARDFSETSIPLEVAVLDILSRRTHFLSEGSVAKAVVASCAVPIMFHPVKIAGRYYYDGGLTRKSGMKHEEAQERILCIFIESNGWMGVYENKTSFSELSENHKVLRFKNLPQVHFNALDQGAKALDEAYRRARTGLELFSDEKIINA
jgi:NTE family protein